VVSDTWNQFGAIDEAICRALGNCGREAISAALGKGAGDPEALRGIARHLFHFSLAESDRGEGWRAVEPSALAEVLPIVAENALANPHGYNRRSAMNALGEIGGPQSVLALRRVLEGKVAVRPVPEDEEVASGGSAVYRSSGEVAIDDPCSDAAYAALLLGKLHDRESLALVRKLAAGATGHEKAVLDRALEELAK